MAAPRAPVIQVQPPRAHSCLTRAGHRPVLWAHEIPDSGISHRNTGSSPRSGTEAGDISPVFTALEHAAGDLATLGKNPPLEGSSPPSDTFSKYISYRYLYGRNPVGMPNGVGWPGPDSGIRAEKTVAAAAVARPYPAERRRRPTSRRGHPTAASPRAEPPVRDAGAPSAPPGLPAPRPSSSSGRPAGRVRRARRAARRVRPASPDGRQRNPSAGDPGHSRFRGDTRPAAAPGRKAAWS